MRTQHKNLFRIMDLMLIFIFIFNIGAMLLTNVLVAKDPAVQFMETNPVVSEAYEFQQHPDAIKLICIFIISVFARWLILFSYVYYRNTIQTEKQMYWLFAATSWIFCLMLFDFFNNLGYFIGVM